jgi:hypothetical protein
MSGISSIAGGTRSFNEASWANQGALERHGGPHVVTALDRRLKQLKFLIESQFETEKSLKALKMVARVLKRIYLVELTPRYMEENQAKKLHPKRDGIENCLECPPWIGLLTSSFQ